MAVRSDGFASLVIKDVDGEDEGDYTVDVANEHGRDKKTVKVTVQGTKY